jgi:Ribosomal protein L4/L1 family.
MANILKNFLNTQKKNQGLLILSESNKDIIKATRNLKFADVTIIDNLSLLDILKYKNLLFVKNAVAKLEDRIK